MKKTKKSYGIANKIWLTLGILMTGYFISIGVSFILGQETESRLQVISEDIFTASTESRTALSSFNTQIKLYNEMIMVGSVGNITEEAQNNANQALNALQAVSRLKRLDKQHLNDIQEVYQELEKFTALVGPLYAKVSSDSEYLFEEGEETENNLEDELFRMGQQTAQIREKLTALSRGFSDQLKTELSLMSQGIRHFRYLNMMIFFCLAGFVGGVAWVVIRKSVTGPLNRIIRNLSESAEGVFSAAVQESSSSQSLARRSSQQAASVEEVSASIDEMASMTKMNADNAGQAHKIMEASLALIRKTDEIMSELTDSMSDILAASKETSKIVKLIDEIAFQTNLLSLNASVEAARAGEAGAGFAVVANEVRNLAMRSAGAAKDSSDLIQGVTQKISNGNQITCRTLEAFKEVADNIESVKTLMAEIAAASDNQDQGIGQLNTVMGEMDHATQENAAAAEEAACFSQKMNEQARQMKQMVSELTLLMGNRREVKRVSGPMVRESANFFRANPEFPSATPEGKTDLPGSLSLSKC